MHQAEPFRRGSRFSHIFRLDVEDYVIRADWTEAEKFAPKSCRCSMCAFASHIVPKAARARTGAAEEGDKEEEAKEAARVATYAESECYRALWEATLEYLEQPPAAATGGGDGGGGDAATLPPPLLWGDVRAEASKEDDPWSVCGLPEWPDEAAGGAPPGGAIGAAGEAADAAAAEAARAADERLVRGCLWPSHARGTWVVA